MGMEHRAAAGHPTCPPLGAPIRVRCSEDCWLSQGLAVPRTELGNQVDLAEAGVGWTQPLLWSARQPGGSRKGPLPPPCSLCGWKMPENLRSCSGWLSRPRCHCTGDREGQEAEQNPQAPQGRMPGSQPQAGAPGLGPEDMPASGNPPLLRPLSWGMATKEPSAQQALGAVVLHSVFGGSVPSALGFNPRPVSRGPSHPPAGPAPSRPWTSWPAAARASGQPLLWPRW